MVINRHERILKASSRTVGALLDQLASSNDVLWSHNRGWSPIKFDRPLQVGAVGGHGFFGYTIEQYIPGQKILFRFTAPKSLNGTHCVYLEPINSNQTRLVHVIEAEIKGIMWFLWTFMFSSLHNALTEDVMDNAQILFEPNTKRQTWSLKVRILRLVMPFIRKLASRKSITAAVQTEP
jgi:hypothetical protein